jgi:hypothetical protein
MASQRLSSVTLIVLGDDLDPGEVTRTLGMFPHQAWQAGEVPQIETPDGRWIAAPRSVEWGGWKKFMPKECHDALLENQLEYWVAELQSKSQAVAGLRSRGWSVTLDCYLSARDVDITTLTTDLLGKLAAVGADVKVYFYPDNSPLTEPPPSTS